MVGKQSLKDLEREILKLISEKLQKNELTPKRAQEIAKFVLTHLKPHMSFGEIYENVKTFDDHFPELAKAALPIIKEYEAQLEAIALTHAQQLLKKGQFNKASTLMQRTISRQVKL